MNLYEDICTDIEDIFRYQKETNDKFVNPKHIGALFCYYTEFDKDVWGKNWTLRVTSKKAYMKMVLFLSLTIDNGYNFNGRCYEMASYLGKYKVNILKEHEEKIKAYIAEHPENSFL